MPPPIFQAHLTNSLSLPALSDYVPYLPVLPASLLTIRYHAHLVNT